MHICSMLSQNDFGTGCNPGVFDGLYPELDTAQERAFRRFRGARGVMDGCLKTSGSLPINQPFKGALGLWEWPGTYNEQPPGPQA